MTFRYHSEELAQLETGSNSIGVADGLLSPSQYLAREIEAQYGIPKDRIEVIPYPLGRIDTIDRDHDAWANGSATCTWIGTGKGNKLAVASFLNCLFALSQSWPNTCTVSPLSASSREMW